MEIITARIDKETKEKMKKLSYINWSDVIRESVIKRIAEEESSKRIIDRNAIAEGMSIASKIRKSSKGWNSTEEIRKWRDQRT
ncbi:MAG: hypothetical protein ACYCT2_09660 [Thermoplasmataceae archaeon]